MIISTEQEIRCKKNKELLEFVCDYCTKIFKRSKKRYLDKKRLCGQKNQFCSGECHNKFKRTHSQLNDIKVHCKSCNKLITKRISKKEINKNHFCSRSCSATYNNSINPKRKKSKRTCKKCNVDITGQGRKTICDNCNNFIIDWSKVTFAEIKAKRRYQKNSRIRDLSRNIYYKSGQPQFCFNCGYDKHIDVCHIIAVSSFPDSAVVSEINSLSNLIALCKNCHWEFDNGYLSLEAK